MADKYEVRRITTGLDKGKWGVYKGSTLMKAWGTKAAATQDANRRNR